MRKAALYIVFGLLGLLAVSAVAGGTAYLVMQGKLAAAAPERSTEDLTDSVVIALEPFVTNLADEGRHRYINVTFELVVPSQREAEKVQANLPLIRDAILGILGRKDSKEVTGEIGSNTLKIEIQSKINSLLGDEYVKQVLITDFAVQF